MNKSTKKIVHYLSKYIGHEIIRTKPAGRYGDWSHTDSPMFLLGFTSDGCIKCRYRRYGKDIERVLPLHFTDYNWITYKKALKAKGNELNKWRGKKIKRIRPTAKIHDGSFMCKFDSDAPVTLVSASKHHMVIMHNAPSLKGNTYILNSAYVKPEDWVLAE